MDSAKKSAKSPNPKSEEKKATPSTSRAENFHADRIERRQTPRLPKRRNEVYVNQATPFVGQFNKCKTLLSSEKEIIIHGLGASVNTAVNLALQLKSFHLDTVSLEATTSTVDLVDDHYSSSRGHTVASRKNSAIHIKITNVSAG